MKAPGALVEASVSVVPSVNVPVCAVNGVRATPCVSETPCMEETPCASVVVTSVPECVLPGTPCVKGAPQAEEAAGAKKAARVCKACCVNETPRVSAPACVGRVVCVSEARCAEETPRVSAPAGVVCVCEARCERERPNVRKAACVRSLCTREMAVGMHEHVAASPGVNVMCSLSLVTRGSVSARVAWRRRLRLWRHQSRVAAVVAIGTGPGLHGSARVVRAVPRTRPPRARLRR